METWSLRIGEVAKGVLQRSFDRQKRFVPVPGMSALGRHLAADLEICTELRVAAPQRSMGQWRLTSETGKSLGEFDALIVTAPAPLARTLLEPTAPHLARQAAAIEYEPTWTLLLSFEQGERLPTNALSFDTGPLRWAADNGSKPGREGHTWVLHAAPEWSRKCLDWSQEQVYSELMEYFCRVTGLTHDNIRYRAAHRWLYASVTNPLAVGALWDQSLYLGVCGDWCQDGGIEGAYLSGQAVAGRLLGQLAAN